MSAPLNALFSWAMVLAVAVSPIIFGANVPIAWALNALVFGTLLAGYGIVVVLKQHELALTIGRILWPLTGTAILLLWIVAQSTSWGFTRLSAAEWRLVTEIIDPNITGSVSINPDATRLAALRFATAVATFLLAFQLASNPLFAERLIKAVAASAATFALYSSILANFGTTWAAQFLPGSLINVETTQHWSGPFVNQNHFAVYEALGLVCVWGLLARRLEKSLSSHGLKGGREVMAKAAASSFELAKHAILMVPIAVGLLMSGSRAALAITLLAMLAMVLIRPAPNAPARAARRVLLGVAILGVASGLVAYADMIAAKLATNDTIQDISERIRVVQVTLTAILARPWTGYGYGTFSDVFSLVRDDTIRLASTWNEAHNIYLEGALGLGVPAVILLWSIVGWAVLRCILGMRRRRRNSLAPTVAVGAAIIVLAHGFVDFSLQIQGVALTFAALLGAGVAQSWGTRETARDARRN